MAAQEFEIPPAKRRKGSKNSRCKDSSVTPTIHIPKLSPLDQRKEPLHLYLPLGCIHQEFTSELKIVEDAKNESWIEVKDCGEIQIEASTKAHIIKLINSSWIRCFRPAKPTKYYSYTYRIYVLPDDVARSTVDRSSKTLKKSMDAIYARLDISQNAWDGVRTSSMEPFDMFATADDSSLYYLFNTLPSPTPQPKLIKDRYSRAAVRDILDEVEPLRGLKTTLYPYQKRSAATMLQREVAPHPQLDPRYESRLTPTGERFYWNARDRTINKNAAYYDSVRGGILAETMGLGKTLICIALIVATKGHWPLIPPQHNISGKKKRDKVGSLQDMCAAAISHHPIPWRQCLEKLEEKEGEVMEECIKVLENNPPIFTVQPVVVRTQRSKTITPPPKQYQLCNCTIIVVPKNLMHQWSSELLKHVESGTLNVFLAGDAKVALPSAEEIAKYDVLLFSRPRFEAENKVNPAMPWYESPLKKLRFLRIIVDEGHNMSNASTNAAIVASKLIDAERRWVVSGTPAKDLMGVEVETNTMTSDLLADNTTKLRQEFLDERKSFSWMQEESSGAIKSLGAMASYFLKARPWCPDADPTGGIRDVAYWDDFIYRHEDFKNKTHTSFSTCLRRVLENLVIKTQPADVEKDIQLPPLTHKIVRLEPSFCDKLTSNLFVLVFTANAITSERTDIDYLFHKNSQRHLHSLISNLRQSAFYWTGFSEKSVIASLEISAKYLAKEGIKCSRNDRQLLIDTAEAVKIAITSPVWKALTDSHEMGIFVDNWPEGSEDTWCFPDCLDDPMAIGLGAVSKAQRFLNSRLSDDDPTHGFKAAGICAMNETLEAALDEGVGERKGAVMVKAGVPSSSVATENDQMGSKRISVSGTSSGSPKKHKSRSTDKTSRKKRSFEQERKKLWTGEDTFEVLDSESSELGQARIVGTASAKFSYLLDRIWELHETEKILVFYSGGNIAYYLSQALDVLHVKHLIYAQTLSGEQRSKYIVLFDIDPTQRVLLMDIKQAAHGLNLSSASRVFFVNPVCRPDVEAQAIKRAHRIGQTKPVRVETLLLKGTTDEAMHERAAKMTRHEHLQAKAYLEDDSTITKIIQEARVLELTEDEKQGRGQMAKLKYSQQIFGRPGREKAKTNLSVLEREIFGNGTNNVNEDVNYEDDDSSRSRLESRQHSITASHADGSITGSMTGGIGEQSNDRPARPSPPVQLSASRQFISDDNTTSNSSSPSLGVFSTQDSSQTNVSVSVFEDVTRLMKVDGQQEQQNGYTSIFGEVSPASTTAPTASTAPTATAASATAIVVATPPPPS